MPSKFRHSNTLHLYCLFFLLVTQSLVALTSTGIFHYQMNAQHCAAIETGNSGTELFSNLSGLNLKHPPKPNHRLRAARCLPAMVPTGNPQKKSDYRDVREWLTCSLFHISNIHFLQFELSPSKMIVYEIFFFLHTDKIFTTFISQTVPAKPRAKPLTISARPRKFNSISLTKLASQNPIFIMQL